ncbi:MAG TPA: hypothetical protein PLG94_14905 [Smithellaceae bacterium]|nr:hypothetical protein [Syntrophales bacterium]HPL67819.1 hypothetical protein [Smithellaceae bacterium]
MDLTKLHLHWGESSYQGKTCRSYSLACAYRKNGKYGQHVVPALVVNGNGLPFYWEVLPGGTADAKTITWLMDRFRERFDISQMTLVFDWGDGF